MYGACVNGLFDKVEKGSCAQQFLAFKKCLQQVCVLLFSIWGPFVRSFENGPDSFLFAESKARVISTPMLEINRSHSTKTKPSKQRAFSF
ncbi:hypothetical protein CcCBS67573_g01812 [Chytriomyces confervae]|uniref:Uncharacterized protein n=1 Tax=Chytriomyces confervae TaxID=246404 RepID=A0A507FKH8_9FUNG|nr:hypothetical protein CcCBS67573_g01812 [Chytriomyces confervae]